MSLRSWVLGSCPSQVAYTASKGGVIALSRELAVVLARRGIRVNAICPGVTATPLAAGLIKDAAALELRRLHIPMGRLATPEEIAAAALFLASDEASYITGQAIPVDGGMFGAYLTPPDRA
jgi:NAD(P)-dependent dehydrogenase (short-subunit alcohol dehydrogenase family)